VPGDTTTCSPPIAYWNFDDNTGTTAKNIVGNGLIGTLTSGPTWEVGKFGSGIKLNTSTINQHVLVAAAAPINDLSAFTYSTWVYLSTITSGDTLFSKNGSSVSMWIDEPIASNFRPTLKISTSGTAMQVLLTHFESFCWQVNHISLYGMEH
jgi:hypothetical protein